jgi:endonuclease/exonuclease/phosphatase family metal-dependent hydrolase
VRVATLNLWGRSGDWPARREALRTGLGALAPDAMGFQEALDRDQVADLIGPGYHVIHSGETAVASRWPFAAVHEIEGERVADFPALTLVAEIAAPEPLVFVNHFPPWAPAHEARRERHAVAVARFVEEIVADRHVVLGGDLDAVPDAASIRFLRGLQGLDGFSVRYLDAWEAIHPGDEGHTFTTRDPLVMQESVVTREEPRRIDYLFVRCTDDGPTLDIADCRLIFDEPPWASDHFGLVADLTPFP